MNTDAPLLNARQVEGIEVRARDGAVGRVDDLLFDDATWTVRYVVVDTGEWLAGRRVLLTPHSLRRHAADSHGVSVDLTVEQIRTSPNAPTDQVTREHEARLHEHYRWPVYWAPAHTPFAADAIPPPAAFERPAPRVPPAEVGRDPHLRSARQVRGFRLAATDGTIGTAEDFLLEPRSWRIAFLIVDTNGWLPGGKVMLEPHTIERVSWTEAKIFVNEERAVVKTHPPYSPEHALDPEYLHGLQRHYQHPPLR
jgi:uncharacterized protein YrrD